MDMLRRLISRGIIITQLICNNNYLFTRLTYVLLLHYLGKKSTA